MRWKEMRCGDFLAIARLPPELVPDFGDGIAPGDDRNGNDVTSVFTSANISARAFCRTALDALVGCPAVKSNS